MAHTVGDITELIHHHLVLSEVDDKAADLNLAQLVRNIEAMMTRQPHHFVEWMTCDDCGTSVSTELIDPDGAGWATDGGFYCTSCRFMEESDDSCSPQ
jgi:hypothetical protein